MDPVAIDLFDALTVDLETIDLDVSTERLHQYIRYHLRSMVYLVVSSVYQDEFGAELRDSYSREEMKIIRHHVKLLCDFLVSQRIPWLKNMGKELKCRLDISSRSPLGNKVPEQG